LNIREIAALANVSPTTVSLVLNNKGGVSQETRDRILAIVKAHNYPHKKKTAPSAHSIYVIKYRDGKYCGESEHSFTTSVGYAIEDECIRRGIEYVNINCSFNNWYSSIKKVTECPLDGIILIGSELTASQQKAVNQINCPCVVFYHRTSFPNMDSVSFDNIELVSIAIEHLYAMGHRDIGYLHSNNKGRNFMHRNDGVLVALNRLNIPQSEPILLTPTFIDAYSDMKNYLQNNQFSHTAFFADNDTIALGAMKALTEKGYRIPEDVSIVGIDNSAYGAVSSPSLSTVDISRSSIGILAVDTLMKRIEHPEWPHSHTNIPGQLVCRDSVLDLSKSLSK